MVVIVQVRHLALMHHVSIGQVRYRARLAQWSDVVGWVLSRCLVISRWYDYRIMVRW